MLPEHKGGNGAADTFNGLVVVFLFSPFKLLKYDEFQGLKSSLVLWLLIQSRSLGATLRSLLVSPTWFCAFNSAVFTDERQH